MIKYSGAIILLLSVSGCLIFTNDPAADKAAAAYCKLMMPVNSGKITLSEALPKAQTPAEKLRIRRCFAMYLWSKENKMPASIELWRIKLNTQLGFLPESRIEYSGDQYSLCPDELPTVETAEKAAFIISDGKIPTLELAAKVRSAHLEAVTAMNFLHKNPIPSARITYLNKCLDLAGAIGVDLPQLNELDDYEQRFDAAAARWKKSREFCK